MIIFVVVSVSQQVLYVSRTDYPGNDKGLDGGGGVVDGVLRVAWASHKKYNNRQ